MSTNPPKYKFPNHNESSEWKKFFIQLRSKAILHIKKHFHDAADQEDVLADLVLNFQF